MANVVTQTTAIHHRASSAWATDEAAIDRWTNEGGAHRRREIEMPVAELTTVSSSQYAGRIMQNIGKGRARSTLPNP